ncbi:MAG TPA: tol-pal system protein YbgF [Hyphomicrobiaceae bacterium]|jgi:tol-pal system protein YbgF
MGRWNHNLLGVAGALLLAAGSAHAEQKAMASASSAQQATKAAPFQVAQARTKGTAARPSGAGADSDLRQRVEQLERQFLDMQVIIGTLESLARNSGTANPSMTSAPGGIGSGADAARIDALETQVRALTAQLEQTSAQIRALGAGGTTRSIDSAPLPPSSSAPVALDAAPSIDFGATVVKRAQGSDPIGQIISEETPTGFGSQVALAAPGAGGGDPKQDYETAYGYLLQQNYAAAERAFEDFLQRYPNDTLAGNAQYWLGESLYVRGQYKAAASAFLKGYQNYSNSSKAPDSLLKLAMSLDKLGQKEAACSSFDELDARFPNAPSHVKTRSLTERQRVGC